MVNHAKKFRGFCLMLPDAMMDRIEYAACFGKPLTKTAWIREAIFEKLERDGVPCEFLKRRVQNGYDTFERKGARQNIDPAYVDMVKGISEDLLGKEEKTENQNIAPYKVEAISGLFMLEDDEND